MPLALTPSPISTHEVAYLGTRLNASRTQTLRVLRTGQSLETPDLQFAHAILSEAETSPANEIPFLGPKNYAKLRPSSYCLAFRIQSPRQLIFRCRFARCKFWHPWMSNIQSVRRPFYSLRSFGFAYIKKVKVYMCVYV